MCACSLRLRRVKRETGSSHAYKCFVTKRKRISGGPATLCVTQKRDGAWNLAWKMTELQHDSCSSYTILVVLSSIGNLNAALYPHTHTHVALALAGKQKKKKPATHVGNGHLTAMTHATIAHRTRTYQSWRENGNDLNGSRTARLLNTCSCLIVLS